MRITLIFLFLLSIVTVPLAFAEEMDCSMCHPQKTSGKSLHAAVLNGCKFCHIGVDASDIPHKFNTSLPYGLTIGQEKLCFSCHEAGEMTNGTSVHSLVKSGMCTTCHDPHSSAYPKLLKADNICYTCHNRSDFMAKGSVHMPVAANMCTSCHNPHTGEKEKLLRNIAPELCFDCHDRKTYSGFDKHAAVSFGMCLSCHDPHRSEYASLARSMVPDLCFICHDSGEVESVKTHQSLQAGKNCSACHSPHLG